MMERAAMILRQLLHTAPIGVSYLFGCGRKAAGAVVDPAGDVQVYLRAADETGLRIRFVMDTHIHADHPSVGRRLSGKPSSTIGFERRHNSAFAMADESEFVRALLQGVPRSPVDAARIRAVNAGITVAA
jgi:glyoxylase-like metal-dependent hydrolase (beta-lactamase superfamily II)